MTWACERFERYLLGREEPSTVETDHKPLLAIINAKDLNQCPPGLTAFKDPSRTFLSCAIRSGKGALGSGYSVSCSSGKR